MKDNKRIRIRLYGEHLGYISYDLYDSFLRICNIIDYSSWVKKISYDNFEIYIAGKESINELKNRVIANYYEDIADWLKEKMREEIRKYTNVEKNG